MRSGEELCFEEVRAARWQQQRREEQEAAAAAAAAGVPGEDDDMELEGDTCAIMAPPGGGAAMAVGGVPLEQQEAAGQPFQMQEEAPCAASPPAAAPAAEQGSPELGVASGVFGSPVPVTAPLQAEQQGPAELPGDEEEGMPAVAEQEAHPTEEAGPAAGGAAACAAAAPASLSPEQPAGRADSVELLAPSPSGEAAGFAGLEPTMTLSTKDAFAAINQMFGVRQAGGAEALHYVVKALLIS